MPLVPEGVETIAFPNAKASIVFMLSPVPSKIGIMTTLLES
jgi:hypothetical protein